MKNVFKKAISVLLVAVMVFGAAPLAGFVGLELPEINLFNAKAKAATYSGTCGENLTWTFDESTGELIISGTGAMGDYEHFNYPWKDYEDKICNVMIDSGVTSIGACVFSDCNNIESVSIPNSVTSIGAYAFYLCTRLENITIPNSVTTIGDNAFYFCESLWNITIGNSVTNIGSYAFYRCVSLKNITIPESVKIIGNGAFYSCTSIENVYYGGSKSEWAQILIGQQNNELRSAKIHYNSTGPDGGSTEVPDNTPNYDSSVTDTFLVPTPTETTISYGDSIVLHVDPAKIPEGGYVEWYVSNSNFSCSVSADGTTCTITPDKKGDTTFTAIVYDAEGNIVSADEQTMTSKAGFFDKIIAFFKKLFGLTKTIPEAFKGIY